MLKCLDKTWVGQLLLCSSAFGSLSVSVTVHIISVLPRKKCFFCRSSSSKNTFVQRMCSMANKEPVFWRMLVCLCKNAMQKLFPHVVMMGLIRNWTWCTLNPDFTCYFLPCSLFAHAYRKVLSLSLSLWLCALFCAFAYLTNPWYFTFDKMKNTQKKDKEMEGNHKF